MFNLHKTRIKTALSRKDMQCCFKHIESSLRYHPNGTRFFFFSPSKMEELGQKIVIQCAPKKTSYTCWPLCKQGRVAN